MKRFFHGVVVGAATAVGISAATSAIAGTGIAGVGGGVNRGAGKSVDAKSSLTGSVGSSGLEVTNTRNAAGAVGVEATGGNSGSAAIKATNPNDGPALALNTAGTVPPFKVTSA